MNRAELDVKKRQGTLPWQNVQLNFLGIDLTMISQ